MVEAEELRLGRFWRELLCSGGGARRGFLAGRRHVGRELGWGGGGVAGWALEVRGERVSCYRR